MKEISYYGMALRAILREAGDDRLNDSEFINARVEKASEAYEKMRLNGHTPYSALEGAWNTLVEGIFNKEK